MKTANGQVRAKIMLRGVVQGVGFRPFVYRLANELHVAGWVNNTSSGLFIEAEADKFTVETFISRLHIEKPSHSSVYSTETTYLDPAGYAGFTIRESDPDDEPTTLILPDIALCNDCQNEMTDPTDRRYRYPFINCTNCGPRFSIVESLPYDRPNTTMKIFPMCPDCEKEYHDPNDRRFHAQPTACPECGPHLELWNRKGEVLYVHDEALQESARALKLGNIVAMKGLGGFQLLVDASNEEAVKELRKRKHREEKPFAIMFMDLEKVKEVCEVSGMEERLLLSAESPIVLLKRKTGVITKDSRATHVQVTECVAPGNPFLGIMLPYTPLHHLLMNALPFPVVATSGNISDEPMCIDEMDALKKLGGIADLFLIHDRPIRRYVDDSIVRVVAGREMVMRRARGYAPLPIMTSYSADEPVLALGGHLKNTVAMQKKNMLFVSQHIGDLETAPALKCLENTVEDVLIMYNVRPSVILHDKHPNYASTTYAKNLPVPKESFQHHFAHIASCMAENELNEPLLGISWDGTGYGLDGTIWGGEFVGYDGNSFSRIASLRSFLLPGGDAAVKESIRSGVGLLFEIFGSEVFRHPLLHDAFSVTESRLIIQMMEKGINSPRTSSMGRLFDGVGALLGIRRRANYEGQTAMLLEFSAMESNCIGSYPFEIKMKAEDHAVIDWIPMIVALTGDVSKAMPVNEIARKFHNTLPEMIVAVAQKNIYKKVLLSGGCFQNALLLEMAIRRLREEGYSPYWHQRIPTNDGGISAGQIYMHHLIEN